MFVALRGAGSRPLPEGDGVNDAGALAALARSAVPDVSGYLVGEFGGTLRAVNHADGGVSQAVGEGVSILATLARPVGLVRVGNDVAPTDGDDAQAPWLRFAPVPTFNDGAGPLQPAVFDPAAGRFKPLEGRVVVLPADTAYARSTAAALRHRAYQENPVGGNVELAEVAALSRRANTLVGATSFIVVENSAQWETLRRKEAQKLANAPALEVEEAVPEPGTWALLLAGGGCVAFAVYRRRRRGNPLARPGFPV